MGARLLSYKDNRAANSMSAEKLQPCHTYKLLESSTNAASFVAAACSHPNLFVLPFSRELIRGAA
jgi:hypothetical protein